MRVFVHRGGQGWGWSQGRFPRGFWGQTSFGDRAWRAALIAATMIVLLPLVLLVLAAVAAGVVTFVAYVLMGRAIETVRGWLGLRPSTVAPAPPADDGRRNVTVIDVGKS